MRTCFVTTYCTITFALVFQDLQGQTQSRLLAALSEIKVVHVREYKVIRGWGGSVPLQMRDSKKR